MGAKAINTFREMIEDKLGEYLTDWRFHGHLTVYCGVEATEEEKERFRASLAGTTLAPVNLLLQVPLGSNLNEFGKKETKGGVMNA